MQTGTGEFLSTILVKTSPEPPKPNNQPILHLSRTQYPPLVREHRVSHVVPPSSLRIESTGAQTPKRSPKYAVNEPERVILVRSGDKVVQNPLAKSQDAEDVNEIIANTGAQRRHHSLPSCSDDSNGLTNSSKGLGSCESENSSSPEDDRFLSGTQKPSVVPQTFYFSRTEHPYRLQTSIAQRLSVREDTSPSGTEDEENEKPLDSPESDPRQNTLIEIMNTEKLHLKTMGIINAIFKVINNRPKIHTQHTKRAQELSTSLLQLQNDYVTRLEEKLKTPLDTKIPVADVFQGVRTRQEQLLKYQTLSHTLIDYCEGLQEKGQLCLNDFANFVPNKKNTISKSQNSSCETKYWFRNNLQAPFPWISQTIENIKLLMTLTPSVNPDEIELKQLFISLTNSLHLTRPVCMFGEETLGKYDRQLKVHSLIVELETLQSNERKLRYLLLFSDVLVCAKIRMYRKDRKFPGFGHRLNFGEAGLGTSGGSIGSSGKQRTLERFSTLVRGNSPVPMSTDAQSPEDQYARLETRWIIPLDQLILGANSQVSEDQHKIAERLERMSEMKEKIRKIRYELKVSEAERPLAAMRTAEVKCIS
ncbi:hypothetical protein FGIG_02834 [Fasciola gigantica]|uniref:DH domain-containing protein n=1 Tax=Fasciola gigantica TaxID=46835 RepID=A0A504Y872_FASGI|nr:hypothetical protein FGIG_02834 [Fasciola gigantica]